MDHPDQSPMNLPGAHDGKRIGLVLGAGGTVGCAYHAGVLFSIQQHTGFDPRDSTTIVGTSAGSLVGALLRCGVSAEDLIAVLTGVPPISEGGDVVTAFFEAHAADRPVLRHSFSGMRLPTALGVLHSMRRRSFTPALLSMAKAGVNDLAGSLAHLDVLAGGGWPGKDLRICTVALPKAKRKVLTARDGVSLVTAVAASCAIPGVFAPQKVHGRRLVDGGVHSVTNADLLAQDPLDEVWAIVPMAGRGPGPPAAKAMQRQVRGQLRRELAHLPSSIKVRIFQPGPEALKVMGVNLMSDDRTVPTVRAAFLETGDVLSA